MLTQASLSFSERSVLFLQQRLSCPKLLHFLFSQSKFILLLINSLLLPLSEILVLVDVRLHEVCLSAELVVVGTESFQVSLMVENLAYFLLY